MHVPAQRAGNFFFRGTGLPTAVRKNQPLVPRSNFGGKVCARTARWFRGQTLPVLRHGGGRYHSRSKGAPLLATVIGPSPSGPEFLYIQYQGTREKVLDHTAANLSRLEEVQDASSESPGSPAADSSATAPTATPHLPIPKPAPKRSKKQVLQPSWTSIFSPLPQPKMTPTMMPLWF